MRPSRLKGHSQWLARPEQVTLTDHLVKRGRAQGLGKGGQWRRFKQVSHAARSLHAHDIGALRGDKLKNLVGHGRVTHEARKIDVCVLPKGI